MSGAYNNFDKFFSPLKQISLELFLSGQFSDIDLHFISKDETYPFTINFTLKKEDDKFRLNIFQCLVIGQTQIKQGIIVFYELETKEDTTRYHFNAKDFYSLIKYDVSVEKNDDLSDSLYDFILEILPFIPVYKKDIDSKLSTIEFSNFSASPFIFNRELQGKQSLVSLIEAYYA